MLTILFYRLAIPGQFIESINLQAIFFGVLAANRCDFTIDTGAHFSWQHDARFLPHNTISLFDDNCCESSTIPSGTPPAHGLILKLDLDDMSAHAKKTYFHNPNLQISSQGNVQTLANGNKFIGWGQSQYFAEYNKAGNSVNDPELNTLYDAKMPGNNYTYRAYRNDWVGLPYYPPSIAVKSSKEKNIVYASWNGSTETTTWVVYAGSCPGNLSRVKSEDQIRV